MGLGVSLVSGRGSGVRVRVRGVCLVGEGGVGSISVRLGLIKH